MKVQRFGALHGISHTAFSLTLVRIGRETPGMRWDPINRAWVGPPDAVELVASKLKAAGIRLEGLVPEASIQEQLMPVAAKGLRDYQKVGVDFLLSRGPHGALLADDMGLGKTCQTLTAARALKQKLLVVCPNYVRQTWVDEIAKWWPAMGASIYLPATRKSIPIPDTTQVVIIHYDIFTNWAESIRDWNPGVFVSDEAQAYQSETSQRSKAARVIRTVAKYTWMLTGTPPCERPRDLWNVLDIMAPGSFGNFFAYGMRYCAAHKEQVTPLKTVWKFDGKSNLDELNLRLSHRMLRRLKSDVALELPAKTRQLVSIDLAKKPRCQQETEMSQRAIRAMLDASADAKIDSVADIVLDHVRSGRRVVAFTWRKAVAEHIANMASLEKLPCELIHGGVPALRRGAAIERARKWQSGGLLSATIDSCATGIDLTFADVAVFGELVYEPKKLLQAEARLHRFGQHNPVLIQYIIAGGTIDELVARAVISKLDTFEAAVGTTGEGLGASLQKSEETVMQELYDMISGAGAVKTRKRRAS